MGFPPCEDPLYGSFLGEATILPFHVLRTQSSRVPHTFPSSPFAGIISESHGFENPRVPVVAVVKYRPLYDL